MADNLTTQTSAISSIGGGTSVATDDVSNVHYQVIKLADGTAESSTRIPGGSTGLHITTFSVVRQLTLSLSGGAAYADGDVLADFQALGSAVRQNNGTGIMQSVNILDIDDQGQALDIILASSPITLGTENEAVSISDTDASKILAGIEVATADYIDLVNSQFATKSNLGIGIQPDDGGTSIYIAAISRGTGTYTASGITLRFGILQD